jgi:hypothetical protein
MAVKIDQKTLIAGGINFNLGVFTGDGHIRDDQVTLLLAANSVSAGFKSPRVIMAAVGS